ncbi:hypothetical protein ACIFOT_21430 [Neobacillus sp. NRS-1170]|uniref:hypothetical protein n=1 Tax=Neobacillus sp. NRS-1170 TaxID=3233898 RepID=UPI003D29879B
MDFIKELGLGTAIFSVIAGGLLIELLQYVVTLPYAFFKYRFDREKPFLEIWYESALLIEKLTKLASLSFLIVFIGVILYATFQ